MEFLNPGLIGWAALAAVPLAIHLLHRPKPKSRPFPTLLFLRRTARRSRAFASMRHLILMALRMAAVMLVAIAIARPRLPGSAPGGEDGVAAAIVVDDSFRLGYGDGGLSRFDEARRRALDLLSSFPPGSETCVAFASGESTDLAPDPGAVEGVLRRSRESLLAVPVLPAVAEGARALSGARSRRRELHVFTDLARFAWSGASRESMKAIAGLPITIHDVGRDASVNAAVTKVEVLPSAPRQGRPVEIAATIAAWGRKDPCTVVLKIAGRASDEKALAVPDGGTAVVRFRAEPPEGDVLHGTVSIATPDPLALDNARHFAAPVGKSPRILVVESGDPDHAPFVSYALAPPSLEQQGVARIAPAELPSCSLKEFDVIFISGRADVGDKPLQELAAWVHDGGGLAILAPGEALARAGLYPPHQGDVPAEVRLAPGSSDSPAFHAFRAGRNGDLTSATITRRVAFGALDRWRPALLFNDGTPAVLETLAGRGRVLALAFEASPASTDLPRYPCFVPLMHEIARYLAGTKTAEREFEAGAPVLLPLQKPTGSSEYRFVDLATGGRETRPCDPASPALAVARSLPAGRYQVEAAGSIRPFAVNIDAAGSDPSRVDRAELERLLPGSPISYSHRRGGVAEIRHARAGIELTWIALAVVVLALLVELWLAKSP